MIRLGENAFPAYHRILESPDATSEDVVAVLAFLIQVKGDRKSFIEPAITGLAHSQARVREAAVRLLAKIGTPKETPPIVALLSDKEWTLSIAAAEALAEMGDQRVLAAMEVWLNSDNPRTGNERTDSHVRKYIVKYRDQLKARLDKEKSKAPSK